MRGGQPTGARLGTQGPDQGYAYKLVGSFDDRLVLGAVHKADAVAVAVAVAMKRAATYGRAPVVHDLTAGFTVFGFLDADAPADLVEWREAELPDCDVVVILDVLHYVDHAAQDALLQRVRSALGTQAAANVPMT